MRDRIAAEIKKVVASSKKAAFTPAVATSTPPRAGPTARQTLNVPWMMALARARFPSPTTLGIAANIEFPHPNHLVADILAAAEGIERADDPWAPGRLVWTVLRVIDESLDQPWCALLAHHLGAGETPESHRRGRRYSTAAALARLFTSYGENRPDMLVGWAAGGHSDGAGAPVAEDLAWQVELWQRVRERVGTPSPAERLTEACRRLAAEPDLVVFNGVADQYLHEPIEVGVEDSIRAWVVNNGPSADSSFHVVGTIFDTVVKEGVELSADNPQRWGSQALDLAPAQGGYVEFTLATDGLYPIVTHAFNHTGAGALGRCGWFVGLSYLAVVSRTVGRRECRPESRLR
jgi:hypothetical protein